jgi:hypothetical protein
MLIKRLLPFLLLLIAACTLTPSQSSDVAPAGAQTSEPARVLLRAIEARLGASNAWGLGVDPISPTARVARSRRDGPAFQLEDIRSGMRVHVRLVGAREGLPEHADGVLVYRDALAPGAHLIQSELPNGLEDFLSFDTSAASEIRYELDLGSSVAGLRLVANTLEFVDVDGAPRLRMAPPYLVDATGTQRAVDIAVEGCRIDTNPVAPWGRPAVSPGAYKCTVRGSWDSQALYPIVVDPFWQTTGSLKEARASHAATLLTTGPLKGKVLVTGGDTPKPCPPPQICTLTSLASAELYDPTSGTWATTAAMSNGRTEHTMTSLGNGKVLAVGGRDQALFLSTSELYDPNTGTWSNAGAISARARHTATLLNDDTVLVAGGESDDGIALATTTFFDPNGPTWKPGPAMAFRRSVHTATRLEDGTVLLVGGQGGTSFSSNFNSLTQAELLVSGAWSPVQQMSNARVGHTANLLPSGQVLVAGGLDDLGNTVKKFEVYSIKNQSWMIAGSLIVERRQFTTSLLSNGWLLIAGGTAEPSSFPTATELYKTPLSEGIKQDELKTGRTGHTATVLEDGRVLVAAGMNYTGYTTSAEVFSLLQAGEKCSSEAYCQSGFCADGVCCDKACGGTCEACSSAGKGAGSDGVCDFVASGTDPQSSCPAEGEASCGMTGVCDGAGACSRYPESTVCAPLTCKDGIISEASCNAGGQCVATTMSCVPYGCDIDKCNTTCKSIDDCAAPNVCTQEGTCIPPPVQPTVVEGCGCQLPGRLDGGRAEWMALGGVVVAMLRSRRRSRRVSGRAER